MVHAKSWSIFLLGGNIFVQSVAYLFTEFAWKMPFSNISSQFMYVLDKIFVDNLRFLVIFTYLKYFCAFLSFIIVMEYSPVLGQSLDFFKNSIYHWNISLDTFTVDKFSLIFSYSAQIFHFKNLVEGMDLYRVAEETPAAYVDVINGELVHGDAFSPDPG